jgi:hypothetical protein
MVAAGVAVTTAIGRWATGTGVRGAAGGTVDRVTAEAGTTATT